jgi:Flp pilus assembly protein TadG
MTDTAGTRGRLARELASIRRQFAHFAGNKGLGCRGAISVEFAIFAPALVLLLVSVLDLGMGVYRKMQVQNAAQAGAAYAVLHGFTVSSIQDAVTSATSFSSVSASPAPSKFCGCASNSGVATATCGSTCSGGSSPGTYVTVSAQGTYNTLLPYPMVPNSYTLTAQSTVRLQ